MMTRVEHKYLVDDGLDGSNVQHPLYLLAVEVGQTNALCKTLFNTFLHGPPCVHVVHIAEN
jgi:hypothetical protein